MLCYKYSEPGAGSDNNKSIQLEQIIYFINYCLSTDAFRWRQLRGKELLVVFDNNKPIVIKGDNSLIVKLQTEDHKKNYAAKIMLKGIPEHAKKYQKVYNVNLQPPETGVYKDELELVAPTSLNKIFSIILMPWLEGEQLSEYLAEHKTRINATLVESNFPGLKVRNGKEMLWQKYFKNNSTDKPAVSNYHKAKENKKIIVYTALAIGLLFLVSLSGWYLYISNTDADMYNVSANQNYDSTSSATTIIVPQHAADKHVVIDTSAKLIVVSHRVKSDKKNVLPATPIAKTEPVKIIQPPVTNTKNDDNEKVAIDAREQFPQRKKTNYYTNELRTTAKLIAKKNNPTKSLFRKLDF